MPNRDHNPHKRRLYLPIVRTGGEAGSRSAAALAGAPEALATTHEARSAGCAQTAVPITGRRPEWLRVKARIGPNFADQ